MQTRKIVVAPDKFKGSLTAAEAAEAIARGVQKAVGDGHVVQCPIADGGEGTVDAFLAHGAERKTAFVHGPRGERIQATYALQRQTAIIEMAAASGLGLLKKSQHDPTQTDTFGTGELIGAALKDGAKRLVIGVGGSATNDAGVGMLRALGARFLDSHGRPLNGKILDYMRLCAIDLSRLDPRIRSIPIDVATDVTNPLLGSNGATRIFAEQKGAKPEQISSLERVIEHIATLSEQLLGGKFRDRPGAGAAGGLGFALTAFLGAHTHPGAEVVARECGLEKMLEDASLCMTGEGKIDKQTLGGKTVYRVAEIAHRKGVSTVAFGGTVEDDVIEPLQSLGVTVVPIAPKGMSRDESMRQAKDLLERAASSAVSQATS